MNIVYLPDVDVPDFQPLTHYIPEQYFRTLLRTGALYATPVDGQKSDPHDGTLPARNLVRPTQQDISIVTGLTSALPEAASKFAIAQAQAINRGRGLNYLHSWTMRDHEDAEMWKKYGDGGKGVCIKTTAKRLKEALGIGVFPGQTVNEHGFKVSIELKKAIYSDEDTSIPVIPSYFATTVKRTDFCREFETRVEAHICGDSAMLKYEKSDPPSFQPLPVHFDRLFEAVFMGPLMPEISAEELTTLTNAGAKSNVARRSSIALH